MWCSFPRSYDSALHTVDPVALARDAKNENFLKELGEKKLAAMKHRYNEVQLMMGGISPNMRELMEYHHHPEIMAPKFYQRQLTCRFRST